MFYLGGSYSHRKVFFIQKLKGFDVDNKFKIVNRDNFATGFMAWAGVFINDKCNFYIRVSTVC